MKRKNLILTAALLAAIAVPAHSHESHEAAKPAAGAKGAAKHVHREHGAHQHGAGTLGIAFEGAKGKMDFRIPSESIFGFEHEARSDKDKKARADGLSRLEGKIAEMVVFDSALNCRISKDKLEVVSEEHHEEAVQAGAKGVKKTAHHSEHSETAAVFSVTCDRSPVGSEIIFNFQKHFPRIHDLDVQVIADNVQKAVEAKKDGTRLPLK